MFALSLQLDSLHFAGFFMDVYLYFMIFPVLNGFQFFPVFSAVFSS